MYRVKRKRLHPRLGNKRLEEWALFHGDASITNANGAASFDGLDSQLTTNVVDLAGASLTGVGNTVKEVDRLIKKIRLQGGQPTHLFTSFGMQSQINQIVAPDARYIIADGTTVTAGIHAVNYQSPAGVMPVVGDFIEKSPVLREEDANNKAISVKLSRLRQHRGKVSWRRSPDKPLETTRLALWKHQTKDEDIVRSAWRHAEVSRNDPPVPSAHNKLFFVNPSAPYNYNTAGSSGPEGAPTSSIYCLTVPETAVVDLKPIGRTALAVIADSVNRILRSINRAISGKLSVLREGLETIPTEGYLAYARVTPPLTTTRSALWKYQTEDDDIV